MPFPYRYICDLLQQLDDELRKSSGKQVPPESIIRSWFQQHRSLLDAPDSNACAVLSTLLPERRTDRVYNIQAPKLQSIFGKALNLGTSRVLELRRWTEPGSGLDLADCIEAALRRTPNSRDDTTHLTVEEIDETLGQIAAACRFSSPAVRALYRTSIVRDVSSLLANIYTRLGSRDAKWFTRMVLKNYQPVVLNGQIVYKTYHPLLPQMMKIRDDLSVTAAFLRHINETPDNPSAVAKFLKPSIGTKVGRQPWYKARSIKNCLDMLQGRDVICERKIDGEYCQIHIDLRKTRSQCIQIFSKSGKDSTADRIGLHDVIRTSLKLGDENCPLTQSCILEGELVVYSTKENQILPFHKIRKHVTRSGSFLGTANDSQAHEYEHLMIVYYDVLLVDGESLLGEKNSERFRRLSEIVTCRQGYAELVSRSTIHTSQYSARQSLQELFAQCISSRGEGLVLKPDEPYFDFTPSPVRHRCCNIKLKKEYVQGWGDVGDFAVVGASYDPSKANEYKLPNVKWTHFFIGCLENQHQARAKTEMPQFRITNVVELTGPVLSAVWSQQSPITVPYEENAAFSLTFGGRGAAKNPTVVFPCPLVFDVRCFGFDKEPNTNFFSMRFPQVSKIHHDRSYLDTITFPELQTRAEAAMNIPKEEDSQDMRQWIAALEKMGRGKFAVDGMSQATTISNITSSPPPAKLPQKSSQQAVLDLPTPPSSSATKENMASTGAKLVRSTTTTSAMAGVKRSFTEESTSEYTVKRRRRNTGPSLTNSSQESVSMSSSNRRPHREPLTQANLNLPGKDSVAAQPSSSSIQAGIKSPNKELTPSSPIGYHTAIETFSSPPPMSTRARRSSLVPSNRRNRNESTQVCSVSQNRCALADYSILLAPCISSYAWVTDDLLERHGIFDPLLDPRVWNSVKLGAETSRSSGDYEHDSSPTDASEKKRRIRKICLVESRRKEATSAFLQRIKDLDLRKTDGEREWVTVFDWRVLESITEWESQDNSSKTTDPWRRHYVGIV